MFFEKKIEWSVPEAFEIIMQIANTHTHISYVHYFSTFEQHCANLKGLCSIRLAFASPCLYVQESTCLETASQVSVTNQLVARNLIISAESQITLL